MPTATMLGSSLMSWRTVSRMRSTVSGMCSSLTVGKSDRKIRLHLRSKTAICTRLRANFTPMMWYLAQLRFRPMERRFLSPSMSPVSSMMPCASSFAVILVIAAGVSLMLWRSARVSRCHCGTGIAGCGNGCFPRSMTVGRCTYSCSPPCDSAWTLVELLNILTPLID